MSNDCQNKSVDVEAIKRAFAVMSEIEDDFVGKGRKKCPNCSNVIGARTIICDCGYSFKDKTTGNQKPEAPVSKTYTTPGKGRKQCHSCKKYVGARSLECPNCGVDISKKVEIETDDDPPEEKLKKLTPEMSDIEREYLLRSGFKTGNTTVYGPSGECPLKLQRTDKESVFEWCEFILSDGRDRNLLYMPQAMKYWVRFFYPIGTEEYGVVAEHIDSWVEALTFDYESESNQ